MKIFSASRMIVTVTNMNATLRRIGGFLLLGFSLLSLRAEAAPVTNHWAFQRLSQPIPPAGTHGNAIRTDVDRFIAAAQAARNVTSNPEASRGVLARRLYLTLIGLPPRPDEVAAFVNDPDPRAYEKLVDRLLANPHYGERWGRHWLDVARYADSNGYRYDDDQPTAYHYRDFVIRAFNDDLPYDQFVRWQLAGNELAPNNIDAVTATGFLAVGAKERVEGSPDGRLLVRYDELDDLVGTTSSAMLGLTVSCARCHDHKYDPISTRDYYELAGVFKTGQREVRDAKRPMSAEEQKQLAAGLAEKTKWENESIAWHEKNAALITPILKAQQAQLTRLEAVARDRYFAQTPQATEAKWKDITTRLSRRPVASKYLDKADVDLFIEAGNTVNRLKDPRNGYDPLAVKAVKQQLPDAEIKSWQALDQRRRRIKQRSQDDHDKVLTYADKSREPEPSPILIRGSVTMKGELTQLGFLDALTAPGYQPDLSLRAAQPEAKTTFQRAALAAWITDPERGAGHLLARVMVNRIWQHHFGQGLVRTPNDFGTQGDKPVLPELLDWLAGEFIRSGWSVKHMQRLLLTSAVYRQSTDYDEARAKLEPANSTWWRRSALRLESEILRDSILATSGTLNDQFFGPGIMMPIPKEAIITRSGTPYPTDIVDEPRIRRRSIYAYTKRTVPVPLLQVFDGADSSTSCGERIPTTVPTQALILLNNDMIRARSFDFADRLQREAPGSVTAQIKRAFELALARAALPEETARMEKFYRDQLALRDGDSRSTLADVCQVVFNLNEFIYIN
jgi:hypothetical protein